MFVRTFYNGFSSEERDFRKKRRRDRPLRWQTIVLNHPVIDEALTSRVQMVVECQWLSLEGLMEDLIMYIFEESGLNELVEGLEVVVEEWEYFPKMTDNSAAAKSGRVVYLVVEVAKSLLEDEDIYEEIYRETICNSIWEYTRKVLSAEFRAFLADPELSSYNNSLPPLE